MLSYRHAFHAGNTADILKHLIFSFCLDYMGQKAKPYLYIDTHAGAGLYDLSSGYAVQNREWEQGAGALLQSTAEAPAITGMPLLRPYLTVLRGFYEQKRYPGSPAIALSMLREQDRAVCFELQSTDFEALSGLCSGDRRFSVRREDGPVSLKALLPPGERRACILIDPSWELKTDYDTIPACIEKALRRFPTALYIIWYPLLRATGQGELDAKRRELPARLIAAHTIDCLNVELITADPEKPGTKNMYGSGLVIFNPPWTLKASLDEALPFVARALGACNFVSRTVS
ncbi:ribosomal RNA large subunit methyltransferase J [Spirochaetia bacterium]|nr:ribosomal RNA large subunit methyltransferase J [Spirochaetia bacterium]